MSGGGALSSNGQITQVWRTFGKAQLLLRGAVWEHIAVQCYLAAETDIIRLGGLKSCILALLSVID